MARYFGMRFNVEYHDVEKDILIFREWTFNDIIESVFRRIKVDKFYIHLDNLHLLRPQVGDSVWSEYSKMCYLVVDENIEFYSSPKVLNGHPIIQRNRIAFMWPEVEA